MKITILFSTHVDIFKTKSVFQLGRTSYHMNLCMMADCMNITIQENEMEEIQNEMEEI